MICDNFTLSEIQARGLGHLFQYPPIGQSLPLVKEVRPVSMFLNHC